MGAKVENLFFGFTSALSFSVNCIGTDGLGDRFPNVGDSFSGIYYTFSSSSSIIIDGRFLYTTADLDGDASFILLSNCLYYFAIFSIFADSCSIFDGFCYSIFANSYSIFDGLCSCYSSFFSCFIGLSSTFT